MLPLLLLLALPAGLGAAEAGAPAVAGIRLEFLLFGATLLGVALFHKRTFEVAVCGLGAVLLLKLLGPGFGPYPGGEQAVQGLAGLAGHLAHEWVTLANLACLLLGFALLADHFERSHLPALLPRWLPDGWKGAWALLVLVALLSTFLDNIAAAMIGGTIAAVLFQRRVHIGYLAAIVAASNAGGAGSVVGDTTTTMMWLKGISPLSVLHAFVGAVVCLLLGFIPARQQHALQPMVADESAAGVRIDRMRLGIVAFILACAIGANVAVNTAFPRLGLAGWADRFPWIGAAVWLALLLAAPLRPVSWELLRSSLKGTCFLLSLVLCASLMPVRELPAPGWPTALSLGFLSAVFDNIPLTALALNQGAQDWGPGGGYDWGFLAFAVGFGGSMVWFGSSAGVALSNRFPEARSVGSWLRYGWHVVLAYVLGFALMLLWPGWHPSPIGTAPTAAPATAGSPLSPPAAGPAR